LCGPKDRVCPQPKTPRRSQSRAQLGRPRIQQRLKSTSQPTSKMQINFDRIAEESFEADQFRPVPKRLCIRSWQLCDTGGDPPCLFVGERSVTYCRAPIFCVGLKNGAQWVWFILLLEDRDIAMPHYYFVVQPDCSGTEGRVDKTRPAQACPYQTRRDPHQSRRRAVDGTARGGRPTFSADTARTTFHFDPYVSRHAAEACPQLVHALEFILQMPLVQGFKKDQPASLSANSILISIKDADGQV
jgi:hypothetical protein